MARDEIIELPELPYSYKTQVPSTKSGLRADFDANGAILVQELGVDPRNRAEYASEVVLHHHEVELAPVDRGFGAWSYVCLSFFVMGRRHVSQVAASCCFHGRVTRPSLGVS